MIILLTFCTLKKAKQSHRHCQEDSELQKNFILPKTLSFITQARKKLIYKLKKQIKQKLNKIDEY